MYMSVYECTTHAREYRGMHAGEYGCIRTSAYKCIYCSYMMCTFNIHICIHTCEYICIYVWYMYTCIHTATLPIENSDFRPSTDSLFPSISIGISWTRGHPVWKHTRTTMLVRSPQPGPRRRSGHTPTPSAFVTLRARRGV